MTKVKLAGSFFQLGKKQSSSSSSIINYSVQGVLNQNRDSRAGTRARETRREFFPGVLVTCVASVKRRQCIMGTYSYQQKLIRHFSKKNLGGGILPKSSNLQEKRLEIRI